jgi:hypothetical protein
MTWMGNDNLGYRQQIVSPSLIVGTSSSGAWRSLMARSTSPVRSAATAERRRSWPRLRIPTKAATYSNLMAATLPI